MNGYHLYLKQDGGENFLSIVSDDTLYHSVEHVSEYKYRSSPIFPILPNISKSPESHDSYKIGFFYINNVFSVIAKLISDMPSEKQEGFWFSHGLASLIVFSDSFTTFEEINSICCEDLRAYEWWEVNSQKVSPYKNWIHPVEIDFQSFPKIVAFSDLPFEITVLLREIQHTINIVTLKSSIYLPYQIEVIEKLIESINLIICDLYYLFDITCPSSQSSLLMTKIDLTEKHKLVQQRVGDLAQISASLIATLSQSLTGTVPIVESECPMRHYSLLGIGLAHCAISKLSIFVEKVFQKYPIDTVIKEVFDLLPELPLSLNKIYQDFSNWHNPEFSVDSYFNRVQTNTNKFNLVYLSTRIGFRESIYSITTPLHILSLADTSPWNPMTISHELLHAHVRAIIGSIFSCKDKQKYPQDYFQDFFNQFLADLLGKSTTKSNHLIDSIRSVIFNYCHKINNIKKIQKKLLSGGELDNNKIKTVLTSPSFDMIANQLMDAYKEINEIFVHVLDYHYFYDSNDIFYINLLWESWEPVPGVINDIEFYLYRTFLAIASSKTGTVQERFLTTLDIIKTQLKVLNTKNPNNAIVDKALKILSDQKSLTFLRHRFPFGLSLTESVTSFFLSNHIHGALFQDTNCSKKEGLYFHDIETIEFNDIEIHSPFAFISDRLRRSFFDEQTDISIEHRSAWMLLVCASSK